jgi:hypothetical protein
MYSRGFITEDNMQTYHGHTNLRAIRRNNRLEHIFSLLNKLLAGALFMLWAIAAAYQLAVYMGW